MSKIIAAYGLYIFILIFMFISAIWIMYDTRKRAVPLSETIAWGLFSFCFVGIGLILYFFWRKKFYPLPQKNSE